jgi:hypothetical protein
MEYPSPPVQPTTHHLRQLCNEKLQDLHPQFWGGGEYQDAVYRPTNSKFYQVKDGAGAEILEDLLKNLLIHGSSGTGSVANKGSSGTEAAGEKAKQDSEKAMEENIHAQQALQHAQDQRAETWIKVKQPSFSAPMKLLDKRPLEYRVQPTESSRRNRAMKDDAKQG